MLEYRIQKFDGKWIFETPQYLCYTTKEMAQRSIDREVRDWERLKKYEHTACSKLDIEHFSNPDNWRIMEREVTEWKPV